MVVNTPSNFYVQNRKSMSLLDACNVEFASFLKKLNDYMEKGDVNKTIKDDDSENDNKILFRYSQRLNLLRNKFSKAMYEFIKSKDKEIYCFAKMNEKNKYFRAQIVGVDDLDSNNDDDNNTSVKIRVLFVDYGDYNSVDLNDIYLDSFNIYLYDGGHEVKDHYNALKYYYDILEDVFIYLVDDWNWYSVRDGTMMAINDLKLNVIFRHEEFMSDEDLKNMPNHNGKKTWWNGIGIFILSKTPKVRNGEVEIKSLFDKYIFI
jgi:hypothetical protein